MPKRHIMLISAGATASIMILASAAFACTTVANSGRTTITAINGTTGLQCDGQGSNNGVYNAYSVGDNSYNSSCSARANQTIAVEATGANTAPPKYNLYFLNHESNQDVMDNCMGTSKPGGGYYEEQIGGPTAVQSNGNIASTSGTIPSGATNTNSSTGPALVCFLSANSSGSTTFSYATNPAELVIF